MIVKHIYLAVMPKWLLPVEATSEPEAQEIALRALVKKMKACHFVCRLDPSAHYINGNPPERLEEQSP